jgi:hypothetical protein
MPEQLPRISIPEGEFPLMVTRAAACVLNDDRGHREPEDLERVISCLRDYLDRSAKDDEGVEGFWWGVKAMAGTRMADR